MTINPPDKLKKLLFCKCLKKTKKAFEKGWTENGYTYQEIQGWTKSGGNYGVLGGVKGNVIVDFDDTTFYEDQSIFFPKTFKSRTPGKIKEGEWLGYGYHLHLYCHDLDGSAVIYNKEGKQVGELRYSGQMAMGPGSVHPDHTPDRVYEIVDDCDMAELSAKELIASLGPYNIQYSKEKRTFDEKKYDTSAAIYPVIKNLKLSAVGKELQGDHPVHGSTTGHNFSVDTEKNVWHCFRCASGGGAIQLIAVLEGIIECRNAPQGLRGAKFKEAKEIAREKYGIVIKEKEKDTSIILAEEFLERNCVVYSEEDNSFYIYLDNYYQKITDIDLNKMLLKMDGWERLSLSMIDQCIKRIKVIVGKHMKDFNDGLYLNLKNGIYRLDTRVMEEHSSEILSTIRLPYDYDKEAKCKKWLKFLDESLGSKERIQTLQEFMGYSITKETKFEKALCMTGEGRNGKGVITYVLHHLIGEENISDLGLEYFGDTQMIRVLVNKMVNISEEVRENAVNFDAEFKKITSGEPITVNQKYVDIYSFRPFCKLIMNINNFPHISDKSRAFYERLLVIPFDKTFEEEERDSDLKHTLVREELSGILNWVLEGQKRLFDRGNFVITEESSKFISSLKKENNPVEQFKDEEINFSKKDLDGFYTTKDDIYKCYREWCTKTSHKAYATSKFFMQLYRVLKIKPKDSWRETSGDKKRYVPYLELVNNKLTTKRLEQGWGE